MVNTFGYISESTYMVPSTGKNKTRLRLDQLGLSLLRGLHVCFVSFEGLTHAKQRKVADWKHQTPIQPKHEATSRSSCRRCLSSASSACSTCPHLQSQAITDQWWIAPLGHRICLKNPKTMHSLAPKNWFQNDIEIQILWGDIGLARNMCKFQPHKPGPTQTPCVPPVRELWVACSATQELPTRPSYAPKTLEQKRKSVGTKKAVLEVLGQKKSTLDTQVTHWHTASKRCQPAWLQTYRDWRIDRWIGGR